MFYMCTMYINCVYSEHTVKRYTISPPHFDITST